MKKQLLLGTALFAAAGLFAQSGKVKPQPTGIVNMAEVLAKKYAAFYNPSESTPSGKATASQMSEEASAPEMDNAKGAAVATPTVQWRAITGMANIFGALVSSQKPLQYNDDLNVVSWVHRKSSAPSAVTSPANNSGSIIMHLTSNWGATWDSTCIWSNGTNLARYPQGGIYNPPGNQNINNAYGVVCGPITGGSGWIGNFYASKQLGSGNYDYTASATPGAQQFLANTGTFSPTLTKHDFSRYGFTSTDDGFVRSVAGRYYGYNNGQPDDFRGAAVVKGTFNAGVFNWTTDTLMPNTIMNGNGGKQLWGQPSMAWNESGTVGYVVMIGALATATGNNLGWQPIVYKTTNSGASWSLINGIDFNSPAMAPILDAVPSVNTNSNITAPFWGIGEGWDLTVDANNRLHLVTTLQGSYSQHPDSLAYSYQFGTEKYSWGHTPGFRPFVYDFIGDGTGPWTYRTIDSLSTEGPGSTPTSGGYAENPWDADPGSNNKVTSDTRIQVSRDRDGLFIVYTFAESDTNFTNNAVKWNSLPNIKARAMVVTQGSTLTTISPTEINVTKPTPAAVPVTYSNNPNVANRAMFHYTSRSAGIVSCANNTLTLRVPIAVNNSNPYSQLGENRTWYSSAILDFGGLTNCTGVKESLAYNVNGIEIYPNPASGDATVAVDLKEAGSVSVEVYNLMGQLVVSTNGNGQIGDNKFNLNVEGLNAGVYMVKVKAGNTSSTKKIIIK